MKLYDENWIRKTAADLLPKVRGNFIWMLAARTASEQVRFPLHLEPRAGGGVDFTISWVGFKEVVKGGEGETAISSSKPSHHFLCLTVPPGADFGLLQALPRVAQILLDKVCERRGQVTETHQGSGGTNLTLGTRTTTAEMWTYTWPA